MKLNIGAGYKRFPGFLNVDSDKNCNPDYLVDLDDKNLVLPFDDNSVEEVIAHHILEHIGDGYFRLLQELYRVCKSGATIDIRVPHPNHECYINDPTHKRPIMPEGLRLFSKKHNKHEIERGGTSSTLGLMYDVDFEIVTYDFIHDGFYDEIKPKLSQLELQRLFREALNTCIEIHIMLAVVKNGITTSS
jgi:SAM-dependent methyltransferase